MREVEAGIVHFFDGRTKRREPEAVDYIISLPPRPQLSTPTEPRAAFLQAWLPVAIHPRDGAELEAQRSALPSLLAFAVVGILKPRLNRELEPQCA